MGAKTKVRPVKGDPVKDWNKEMESWPIEKDEEGPEKPTRWHRSCDACYPPGFDNKGVALCGAPTRKATAAERASVRKEICAECSVIQHRRPYSPCPNSDCPRRSWLGRAWKSLRSDWGW